jgi:hypothetical protein
MINGSVLHHLFIWLMMGEIGSFIFNNRGSFIFVGAKKNTTTNATNITTNVTMPWSVY